MNSIEYQNVTLVADDEVFKPVMIDGEIYNGYLVSNYKRLYSEKRREFLKLRVKRGSKFYRLCHDGKIKQVSPNSLVDYAFNNKKWKEKLIAENGEIYKPVIYKGIVYDEYLISSYGKVWSEKSEKYLQLYENSEGFISCSLVLNDELKHIFLHYLVAETFIPNSDGFKKVNHRNGIRNKNMVDNLLWSNGNAKRSYDNPEFDVNNIRLLDCDEIFVPLVYNEKIYNEYYISSYGRCYSVCNNAILLQNINSCDYIYYRLKLNDKETSIVADKLVAFAFVKNNNPKGYRKVKHLDCDKRNIGWDNLKWCESEKRTANIKPFDINSIELVSDDETFEVAKTDKQVFGGYMISNYGRLWSRYSNKFIRGIVNNDGYLYYKLEGSTSPISAQRLVGFAFVENPEPLRFDRINHKSEVRTDNYYKNLEWCDNDYNLDYNDARWKPWIGKSVKQFDEYRNLIGEFPSMSKAAIFMGVAFSTLRGWCRSENLNRGFYWTVEN